MRMINAICGRCYTDTLVPLKDIQGKANFWLCGVQGERWTYCDKCVIIQRLIGETP